MNAILDRIERVHPGLLDTLADGLNASDLQSLLLEVARRRSASRTASDVVNDFRTSRFFAPAVAKPADLLDWDNVAAATARDRFELLELSPAAPLGACATVAGVDQNWSVATMRKGELVSDVTNILAIEAAVRRRDGPRDSHLGASARVLRPQNYGAPGSLAHFRLFGLVSAGRDRGSRVFEAEALERHLDFYCDAFARFIPGARLKLAVTGDVLLQTAQDLAARRQLEFGAEDRQTNGYYAGFCFHLYASTADGNWRQLVDGGLVDWGRALASDAKERMLISGTGVEAVLALRR